jgi:hypothetical protein
MLVVGGDEDHLDSWIQQLEHLEAIEPGHLDVEEHQVRLQLGGGAYRIEAVGAFP